MITRGGWRKHIGTILLAGTFLASSQTGHAALFGLLGGFPSYDAKPKTSWIDQIDKRGRIPKPAEVDAALLKPYSNASLGPQVAYSLVNYIDFVRAPEAQALSQAIVDKMLDGWKGTRPLVRVHIRGEPSYGAQANQTGDIFVNIGTFNSDPSKGVQSTDELALILAHELSHLLLPHLANKRSMTELADGISTAASAYVTVSLYSNTRMSGGRLLVQADNDMLMKGVVGGLVSTVLVADILAPSWGTSDELEADMLGVDLARRAGFLIGSDEVRQFVRKHGEALATHSARLEKLKAVGKALVFSNRATVRPTNSGDIFDGLLKDAGNAVFDKITDGIAKMSVSHPDSKKREADLGAYADTVYGDKDTDAKGNLLRRQTREVTEVQTRPKMRSILGSSEMAQLVRDAMINDVASKLPQTAGLVTTAAQPAQPLPIPPPAKLPSEYNALTKTSEPKGKVVTAPARSQFPLACTAPAAAGGKAPRDKKPPAKAASTVMSAPSGLGIRNDFPIDDAPFTWRVRGDWQNSSVTCRNKAADDWARSARTDYGSMDTLQNLALSLTGTPAAEMLPAMYDRYNLLIGTDQDFPHMAVAAALARGDQAGAEVKAAQCYLYRRHSLYPVCVKLLGYDPRNPEGGGARTEEGRKAYAAKGMRGSFDDVIPGGLFAN